MKTLTKQAVLHALNLLIEANESTSTLEIKNHLQSMNYYAIQEDVSTHVKNIFDEDQLNDRKYSRSLKNNEYYVYFLSSPASVATHQSSSPAAIQSSSASKSTKTPRQKTSFNAIITGDTNSGFDRNSIQPYMGKLIAYSPNSSVVHIYDNGINRGRLRVAYRNSTGVSYNRARVCSVKFYLKNVI